MSRATPLRLDPDEEFPHLPRAPIVEAVIHWRARALRVSDRKTLEEHLKARLPEYPHRRPQHEVRWEHEVGSEAAAFRQSETWQGFRVESSDGKNVAQFTRNGFVFSRLAPYENWDRFVEEAKRLWKIHADLAKPAEIERLEVRFINRIGAVSPEFLAEVLNDPPSAPQDIPLPIREFLHQSLYDVPDYPYHLNVIETLQPGVGPNSEGPTLILDIDVFTTTAMDLDEETLNQRLAEMRSLKNKAFFALLTRQALGTFKEHDE